MSRLDDNDLKMLTLFGTSEDCERLLARMIDQRSAIGASDEEKPGFDNGHVRAHMVHVQMNEDLMPEWTIPDDVPLFQMLTVASAANVPSNTLRAWFQRKHVRLSADDTKNHINGLPSKFTLNSVKMIAATAELVRLGLHPRKAFDASDYWMRSRAKSGEMGDLADRLEGGLFPLPMMTYLVVAGDGAPTPHGRPAEVVGINPNEASAHNRLFGALFARGRVSAGVVLLNAIDASVRYVCQQAVLGDNAPPPQGWEAVVANVLASDKA